MALKARIPNLEEVEEPFREQYKQNEGEEDYVLDVQPVSGWELDNLAGLKSAYSAEQEKRKSMGESLKSWAVLGDLQPDDVLKKMDELKELQKLDPEKEADRIADQRAKSQIEQIHAKYQQEINGLQETVNKKQEQLRKEMIENRVNESLGKYNGKPKILKKHLMDQVKFFEEDNELNVYAVDAMGNPRIKDSSGNKMQIDHLVEEHKNDPDWAFAFDGTGASGAGTPTSGQREAAASGKAGAGSVPKHRNDFSDLTAKAEWIGEHGLPAFEELPMAPRDEKAS
jgi:hypothetical protein